MGLCCSTPMAVVSTCGMQDKIGPYLDMAKLLYKELVT